jgi:hypothetical protein
MATETQTGETNSRDDQLYTFEDIPMYARVYYLGRTGWVVGKGGDVSDMSDGDHIKIQYDEEYAGRKASKLHKKLVNSALAKQERLWVDFGFRLDDIEPTDYQ